MAINQDIYTKNRAIMMKRLDRLIDMLEAEGMNAGNEKQILQRLKENSYSKLTQKKMGVQENMNSMLEDWMNDPRLQIKTRQQEINAVKAKTKKYMKSFGKDLDAETQKDIMTFIDLMSIEADERTPYLQEIHESLQQHVADAINEKKSNYVGVYKSLSDKQKTAIRNYRLGKAGLSNVLNFLS